ncbi:MAG TPA: M48 family metallopeptidase [Burkholderiales bacterium]|nr:M48 family metallopeptidase [Burkholderiales bacterium]
MNRRGFLALGCACGALLRPGLSRGDGAGWKPPPRFARPDIASDEGGLWALMDREETRLRRSPFRIKDRGLNDYIQGIACRLGGEHCPDIRVYLVRTPWFNASMAPNGMMQVWSGLMLRADNEAQLAAVLGHEIGHYLARHSVDQLRDAKSRTAFASVLGVVPGVGALAGLGVLGAGFSYTRDHEREADRIGVMLMNKAGYDASEAAKVWDNLLLELEARPGGNPSKNGFFASHPPAEERQSALAELARTMPGGTTNADIWREKTNAFRREWLEDEVKRGQREESVALLTRKIAAEPEQPDYLYFRGEVHRLRAGEGDYDAALADYEAASLEAGAPPELWRGMGTVYRARREIPEARASYRSYLDAAPKAPDAPMIKSYLEELGQ